MRPSEWLDPRVRGGRPPSAFKRWLKRLLVLVVAIIVLLVGAVLIGGLAFSGPGHKGPASDHFDGKRFFNRRAAPHGGFLDFLRWQRTRQPGKWQVRNSPPAEKPPERVGRGQLRVTWINHATVLIQQDGLNILTDPNWSDLVSPVRFVGFGRKHSPGLRFEDLPPIDAVIISHNHYDHLDLPTIRRLAEKHLPRFFVGLGNGALFVDAGIGAVTELDWWQTATLSSEVQLMGVPAQHFSNRGLFDRDNSLWLGYAIRGPAGTSYFAGDTGAGPHFAEIKAKVGSPRLAVLPIGAYLPAWFMSGVHVSPEEAVTAHEQLGASTSVAIHFGTFALADDAQDQPLEDLKKALDRRRPPLPRFWALDFGEGRDVPEGGTATPKDVATPQVVDPDTGPPPPTK
jgi:L-ascorbate metabolism protein UlaG (beta-lactamase superfamily)